MAYREQDVSRDPYAAQEMVQRSGQMGVPVITVDDAVVVGFDQPRLEQLLASAPPDFRLGAAVAPLSGGGVLVGQVHPNTVADRAGLRSGDVILEVGGRPVHDPDQLKALLALVASSGVRMRVRRGGQLVELTLDRS